MTVVNVNKGASHQGANQYQKLLPLGRMRCLPEWRRRGLAKSSVPSTHAVMLSKECAPTHPKSRSYHLRRHHRWHHHRRRGNASGRQCHHLSKKFLSQLVKPIEQDNKLLTKSVTTNDRIDLEKIARKKLEFMVDSLASDIHGYKIQN